MSRWHAPPAELYAVVEHTPATILLESAPTTADSTEGSQQSSPVTRLFTAPLCICIANQLSDLPALFAEIEQAVSTGLYAAGYFTYECAAFFEPTAFVESAPQSIAASSPSPNQPLAWFGIYTQPHLFDHSTGAFIGTDPPALAQFREEPRTENKLESARQPPCPTLSASFCGKGGKPQSQSGFDCTLALTEQQYAQRIHQIHDLIRSGDVYQLNFTLPIAVHAPGSAAALYSHLRAHQPTPYGAFLHTEVHHHILSFSPELFFRIEAERESRRITTRPMKGTAPRGRTTQEDHQAALWLANDPKNRSENVMIVDLLRNDLGRLCTFGSVRASNLFAVERYPTLWQMTSTVTGDLRPEVTFQEIFRALFPCGSVTGAPKIHAMQLLSQLEKQPRGLYTGAIGFFSKEETVFNVAIRTLVLDSERGVMGIGSGIVIDSNPADEWRECLLKAQFLTNTTNAAPRPTPGSFSLVETMLWQGDYPLIELHLDRLEDSAAYFAYPFNRASVQSALGTHAAELAQKPGAPGLASETWESNPPSLPQLNQPQPLRAPSFRLPSGERVGNHEPQPTSEQSHQVQPHKVRLLLNPDGSLQITSEPIAAPSSKPLRVRIAKERTDPQDPTYFHKTTHRPLYAQAIEAGYDDVLFLNHRNEVTESAIHNLFIEKDGRLLTPPIDCGLLPGVHRRHILATNPQAEEKILTLEDLRQASAIYLSNAVRGLRQAIIDWQTA